MLKLRPHHILDIIRDIGNGSDIRPHEYGHLLHAVTESLIYDIDQECQLVVENDDICGPCIHLDENNQCDDILDQTDEKLLKQEYNDKLDRKILSYLEISPMSVINISEFLKMVLTDYIRFNTKIIYAFFMWKKKKFILNPEINLIKA